MRKRCSDHETITVDEIQTETALGECAEGSVDTFIETEPGTALDAEESVDKFIDTFIQIADFAGMALRSLQVALSLRRTIRGFL